MHGAWIALAPLLHQMDMQHASCRCTDMQCHSFIAQPKPPLLPRVDPAHHWTRLVSREDLPNYAITYWTNLSGGDAALPVWR